MIHNFESNTTKCKIEVVWTGSYPCKCHGEWIFKINDIDFSDFLPFQNSPADTYNTYSSWHWEEVWDYYENGLECQEWIEDNNDWLVQIVGTDEELKKAIYHAFQAEDWRHFECGGCI